jgi:phosphatidylethanolamine-binding protein (PEBP) family uncharacterized protein
MRVPIVSIAVFLIVGSILAAESFKVNFAWKLEDRCSISPEIKLIGVPKNSKSLYVQLKDLDLLSADHGGGFVDYSGQNKLVRGTVIPWLGPCPTAGVTHRYELTVTAYNAKIQVLGKASLTRSFPPKPTP